MSITGVRGRGACRNSSAASAVYAFLRKHAVPAPRGPAGLAILSRCPSVAATQCRPQVGTPCPAVCKTSAIITPP